MGAEPVPPAPRHPAPRHRAGPTPQGVETLRGIPPTDLADRGDPRLEPFTHGVGGPARSAAATDTGRPGREDGERLAGRPTRCEDPMRGRLCNSRDIRKRLGYDACLSGRYTPVWGASLPRQTVGPVGASTAGPLVPGSPSKCGSPVSTAPPNSRAVARITASPSPGRANPLDFELFWSS